MRLLFALLLFIAVVTISTDTKAGVEIIPKYNEPQVDWIDPNTKAKNIIAPKYWNDYKRSTGYWRGDDNIVDDWLYIDQKGVIMNGVDCKEEYKEYRKQHCFYDDKPEVV